MNLKYRVKFKITNLNVQETRDFKLNLVNTPNVLEFDSETVPRLPSKSEKIKIADRLFEIENSYIEFIREGDFVYNVFNFDIFDVERKRKDEEEKRNKEFQDKLKTFTTKKSPGKYGFEDEDYDFFSKKLADLYKLK